MIFIICKTCGKKFKSYFSKKAIYCSRECYYKNPESSEKIRKGVLRAYKEGRLTGFQKGHEGYQNSGNFKKGCVSLNKGKHPTKQTRKKISNSLKGEKSNLWKGGISEEHEKIRHGIEFRLWRESVFARDNWTCQKCGNRKVYLHPHHILNFAEYPELRFDIDNGITLCKDCHMKFHTKYGRECNTKEQLKEFLKIKIQENVEKTSSTKN